LGTGLVQPCRPCDYYFHDNHDALENVDDVCNADKYADLFTHIDADPIVDRDKDSYSDRDTDSYAYYN
jgi:hypothetical protein